jgi:hypothetical protein
MVVVILFIRETVVEVFKRERGREKWLVFDDMERDCSDNVIRPIVINSEAATTTTALSAIQPQYQSFSYPKLSSTTTPQSSWSLP